MRIPVVALAAASLSGSLLSTPVQAATVQKTINRNPAGACVLSIPTTNTSVRPKATGFRNEGGVTNFVICSLDIDSADEGFTNLYIYFASIDGASHTFDCTAMDRYNGNITGEYSTKSTTVPAGGTSTLTYLPGDFPTIGLAGWNASITCQLPPGASIITLAGTHNDSVGN